MTPVDPSYFHTDRRWRSYLDRKGRSEPPDGGGASAPTPRSAGKFGTVGAVALDREGNLAAGTSTGGMTMKLWGRIGDSPIIGAGTYANNESCALSATGHGEYFIRNNVTADICARMLYQGISLEEAADNVVMKRLVEQGGEGGVAGMDRMGNIVMTFNSLGMYRGYRRAGEEATVAIFKE